jgi:hypothetical protein
LLHGDIHVVEFAKISNVLRPIVFGELKVLLTQPSYGVALAVSDNNIDDYGFRADFEGGDGRSCGLRVLFSRLCDWGRAGRT